MWLLEFCPRPVKNPSCPSQFTLGACLLKLMAKVNADNCGSLIKWPLIGNKTLTETSLVNVEL